MSENARALAALRPPPFPINHNIIMQQQQQQQDEEAADFGHAAAAAVTMIVGRRGCGKSVLLRELVQRCTTPNTMVSIAAANTGGREWLADLGHDEVAREYSPALATTLFARQSQWQLQQQQQGEEARRAALLVLDDVFYDAKMINNCSAMYMAIMFGRNMNMKTVIATQYPLRLAPDLAANVDLVFLFHEPVTSTRRRMYEIYGRPFFQTFDAFEAAMNETTDNYGCLVLDRTVPSEPRVRRYQATCSRTEIVNEAETMHLPLEEEEGGEGDDSFAA